MKKGNSIHELYSQIGDTIAMASVQELSHKILKNAVNNVLALVSLHKVADSQKFSKPQYTKNLKERLISYRNKVMARTSEDHILLMNRFEDFKLSVKSSEDGKKFREEIDQFSSLVRNNWEKKYLDIEGLRIYIKDCMRILDPVEEEIENFMEIESKVQDEDREESLRNKIEPNVLDKWKVKEEESRVVKTSSKSRTKYFMIGKSGARVQIDNPGKKSSFNYKSSSNFFGYSPVPIVKANRIPGHTPPKQFISRKTTPTRSNLTPSRVDYTKTIASPYRDYRVEQKGSLISRNASRPGLSPNISRRNISQRSIIKSTFKAIDGTMVEIETSKRSPIVPRGASIYQNVDIVSSSVTVPRGNEALSCMIIDAKEDFSKPVIEYFQTNNCKTSIDF